MRIIDHRKMLSNIDDTFLSSLKNEFNSNSSSTYGSSEVLSGYSPIETLTADFDCLPNLSQGKIYFLSIS